MKTVNANSKEKKGFVKTIRAIVARNPLGLTFQQVIGKVRQHKRDSSITPTQITGAVNWMAQKGEVLKTEINGQRGIKSTHIG